MPPSSSLKLGIRTIDLDRGVVEGSCYSATLTSTELRLLVYLAVRPGQPVGRDELYTQVWGYGPGVRSRALDATVRRLRAKLESDPSRPRYLLTEHGVGYRLVVDARLAESVLDRSRAVPPTPGTELELRLANLSTQLDRAEAAGSAIEAVALIRLLRRESRNLQAIELCEAVLRAGLEAWERVWVRAETLRCHHGPRFEAEVAEVWAEALAWGDAALRSRVALISARGEPRYRRLIRAVELAEASGATFLLMQARGQLATCLAHTDPIRAHTLFREALRSAQLLDDTWEEALIGANYARFLQQQGAADEAVGWLTRSLVGFEQWGDRHNQVMSHLNLGVLYAHQLHREQARSQFRLGQQQAEALGAPQLQLICRLNEIACTDGLHAQPIEELEVLLRGCRENAYEPEEALALTLIGLVWRARGKLGLARAPMEQATALATGLGDVAYAAEIEAHLASLLAQLGEPEGVERLRTSIHTLLDQPDHIVPLARFLLRWQTLPQASSEPEFEARLIELANQLPAPPGTPWEGLHHYRRPVNPR